MFLDGVVLVCMIVAVDRCSRSLQPPVDHRPTIWIEENSRKTPKGSCTQPVQRTWASSMNACVINGKKQFHELAHSTRHRAVPTAYRNLTRALVRISFFSPGLWAVCLYWAFVGVFPEFLCGFAKFFSQLLTVFLATSSLSGVRWPVSYTACTSHLTYFMVKKQWNSKSGVQIRDSLFRVQPVVQTSKKNVKSSWQNFFYSVT